jgi:hypothetical protein
MYVRKEKIRKEKRFYTGEGERWTMSDDPSFDTQRKTYYVSVGAGQVLADPEAAAFELEIQANDQELDKLHELFEEIQDADEDNAFHFNGLPSVSDDPEDETYNSLFRDIYRLLHELGTRETREHIESMNIL